MKEVLIKTRSSPVTEENFVDLLNTDELFCDYFNAFLRLPSFIEPLVYNRKTGLFEVLTDVPKELARKIKRYVIAEHRNRRRPLFDSVGKNASNKSETKISSEDLPPFDVCFAVETLERESGMDWIRRNRLPLFLESEVYMEYCLAILMAQVEEVVEDENELVTMKIDSSAKQKEIEDKMTEVVPAGDDIPMEAVIMQAKSIVAETLKFALNIVSILDKQPEDTHSDRDEYEMEDFEDEEEDTVSSSDVTGREDEFSSKEEGEEEDEEEFLREEIARGYLEVRSFEIEGRPGEVTVGQFKDAVIEMKRPTDRKVLFSGFEDKSKEVAMSVTEASMKLRGKEVEKNKGTPSTQESEAQVLSKGAETADCSQEGGHEQLDDKIYSEECKCAMRDMSRDDLYDDNLSMTDNGSLRSLEPKSYALKSLKGVEQFKASLCGLPGEKRWNLWMDIEKAKLITDRTLFDRRLACMKDRYDRIGGPFELAPETKQELGLQDPSSWQMDKLLSVQDQLIEPLLLYWVPAFLVQRKLESRVKPFCALEELRRLDPPPESYPHQRTLPPLPFRPSDCLLPALNLASATISSEDVHRSDSREPSSATLYREPSIPEDEILSMPLASSRRKYILPERRWSVQVSRRRHWRELLEEQEAGWFDKRSSSAAMKSSVLQRLPSVGEMNENYIRKEVMLGQRAVPVILATARRSSPASLEMDTSSELCGGKRMEGLLQALDSDNEAGAFFLKELEKFGNQLWLNALMFWKELQAYHEEVFRSPNDFTFIEKKAKQIFAEFISASAPFSIQCTKSVRESIFKGLIHPADELFDEAEKYALTLLFAAWMHVIEQDLLTFDAIKKIFMLQSLDQGSKYVQYVQKRGLIRKKLQEPVIHSRRKVVYSARSRDRLPSDLRNVTLNDVTRRISKLSGFRKFLADNFAGLDLQCLHDIELYRRIPRSDKAKVVAKAMDIKSKYYNEKYLFGPNSPANKEGQDKIVELTGGMEVVEDPKGILKEASIYELEKYVRKRLEEKWLPLYLNELGKKEAKKEASRVAKKSLKKGRPGSRTSSEERHDKAYLKSKKDKKKGADADGKKKKGDQMDSEEEYRHGVGLEGPAGGVGGVGGGSKGGGGTAGMSSSSSWEHTFYAWAFDREKVLNLFPGSKFQAAAAATPALPRN